MKDDDLSFPHISEIKKLPFSDQEKFWNSLTPDQILAYKHHWPSHARPKQLLPDKGWSEALFLCGRGFGKSRAGSEFIRNAVENQGCKRICLVGPNAGSIREVMFGGESGLETISPPWMKPRFIHSKSKIIWPNGAEALCISAEEPENLRGPQFDVTLWDEPAACKKPDEIYDGIAFGLRLTSSKGYEPRLVMTTTPKPIPLIVDLLEREKNGESGLIVIRGSTDENRENLNERAVRRLYEKYEGTRLGRQELHAEVLSDFPDALWPAESLDLAHKEKIDIENLDELLKNMQRIVVAVDPSGSDGATGDETGIVVAGKHVNGQYYVLADKTLRASPEGWARAVKQAYDDYQADKVVAEKNNGGAMVRSVLQNNWPSAPITLVHAKRGKHIRAEGVSGLYEQGKVTHIKEFVELEEQMSKMTASGYKGRGSPDRLDACVYALLMLRDNKSASLNSLKVTGKIH